MKEAYREHYGRHRLSHLAIESCGRGGSIVANTAPRLYGCIGW